MEIGDHLAEAAAGKPRSRSMAVLRGNEREQVELIDIDI